MPDEDAIAAVANGAVVVAVIQAQVRAQAVLVVVLVHHQIKIQFIMYLFFCFILKTIDHMLLFK